jgi:putative beta-lysine N-acetyltransferase
MFKRHDIVEKFEGAIIQHGTLNDRIYLMHMRDAPPESLATGLIDKAHSKGYSKIFAKIPRKVSKPFKKVGYIQEVEIPCFYNGEEDAVFMGYYLSERRMREENRGELEKVLMLSKKKGEDPQPSSDTLWESNMILRRCTEDDAPHMAQIYKNVFRTYPFPIHDPSYLIETMDSHVNYFGVEADGELIAIASTEKDMKNRNAEMTDFATLPEWRGYGFARQLLGLMEEHAREENILTTYTIARAKSPGMNITFAQNDYQYCGRLINNTNISGQLESMNVWYKPLIS